MTGIFGNINNPVARLIKSAKIVEDDGTTSRQFDGYQKRIYDNVSSLKDRAFDYITRNPNFNLLSTNGLAPVTPTQGTGYEVVTQWLINTGLGNNYTITPTAYTTIGNSIAGSLYFLNFNVSTLVSDLYFSNVNYSPSNFFDSVGQFNGQQVSFSTIINNLNTNTPMVSFSTYINNVGDIPGQGVLIQPGINLINTTIQMPDLTGDSYGVDPYAEIRFNIEDIAGGMNMDVAYLKAEFSNYASDLNVNNILESIICANWM